MLQLDPEERAEPLLRALLNSYRRSQRGRTGSGREFNIRYDKLVHERARATVSEEKRGRAVLDRLRSAGVVRWDHKPLQREKIKTIYISPTAEKELFSAAGETPPEEKRTNDTAVFGEFTGAMTGTRWAGSWDELVAEVIDQFKSGKSPAPFRSGEAAWNRDVLCGLAAVLRNDQPVPMRRFSARIFGDSKRLERLVSGLETLLDSITAEEPMQLADFGISQHPPSLIVHGPLELVLATGRLDLSAARGPISIAHEDIFAAQGLSTTAKRVVTIENHTTFRELARLQSGDLFIATSYPSRAVLTFIEKLPPEIPLFHFGDSDPAGFSILRTLRGRTNRSITALHMVFRGPGGLKLTKRERVLLDSLIADPLLADMKAELSAMRGAGTKGAFEQEALPPPDRSFPYLGSEQ